MPKDEQEFLTYLAKHFRLVESVCANLKGFESDSELHAFLQGHSQAAEAPKRQAKRLKDVGILIHGATGWSTPPFLATFLRQLHERHLLASPAIVRGWIEELKVYSNRLDRLIERSSRDVSGVDSEDMLRVSKDIEDTISKIVQIVHDNCECIAREVAEYRATEEVGRIKQRLSRLVELYEKYLDPVIELVNINGSFYEIGNCIATQCELVAEGEVYFAPATRGRFESLRSLVVWLRNAVLKQAEEAKRELAPLCLAAVKEQKIALGVNRALEFARLGQFAELEIPELLKIVEDKNGPMFSDSAIERYLEDASSYVDEPPPRIEIEPTKELLVPITADELIGKLESGFGTDDLLGWILDNNEDVELELAIQLLLAAVSKRSELVNPTDEMKTYQRNQFEAESFRWTWRNENDRTDKPVPPKTRRSVSTT